jgi:isopenicillin N synthase-like dioxygenase
LDVAKQVRGDLKETYNMGKFADLDYKHNEPETITKRREELLAFQKECYQVELRVLVLFALALDVLSSSNDVDWTVALRLFLEVPHRQGGYIQVYQVHTA